MKKLSTVALAAALIVGSQLAIFSNAHAFSFGNFDMDFDDNDWGPGGGNRWGPGGGNRWGPGGGWGSGPRWGSGNRWGSGPRWGGGRDRGPWGDGPRWRNGPGWSGGGPKFNFGDGDGFNWNSKKGPRWQNQNRGWDRNYYRGQPRPYGPPPRTKSSADYGPDYYRWKPLPDGPRPRWKARPGEGGSAPKGAPPNAGQSAPASPQGN